MAAPTKTNYLDPNVLNKLGNMSLIARCCVQGFFSGLHPSPFHGFSVEYSDHRKYEYGDDLRFLDWKVYARSDKLYIKRFLQETNVPVHILLDTSKSMTFQGESAYSKLDYGSYLSAALAFLLLGQGDSVGLTLFSDRIHTKIPARAANSSACDSYGSTALYGRRANRFGFGSTHFRGNDFTSGYGDPDQ